jgi:hypothetical protein
MRDGFIARKPHHSLNVSRRPHNDAILIAHSPRIVLSSDLVLVKTRSVLALAYKQKIIAEYEGQLWLFDFILRITQGLKERQLSSCAPAALQIP